MFNEGIIYRENRLVNWCCTLKTAISDIEVEYIDILPNSRRRNPGHDQSYDFGQLTSFAYRVEDSGLFVPTPSSIQDKKNGQMKGR